MTEITVSAADAEGTLVRLATCVERAGKLETLKLMLQLAAMLEAPRTTDKIATGGGHDSELS